MVQCYKCQKEITLENQSEEHIFPNSCGGRLKSQDLLCKTCNDDFGKTCDAVFADQVNPFINLLAIKRERNQKSVPSILCEGVVSGTEFWLSSIGDLDLRKPLIEHGMNSDGEILVHIGRHNIKNARHILQKKYPEINVGQELSSAIATRHYVGEPVRFDLQFGNECFFKAVVKIAINYFIYSGGERNYAEQALQFIDNADVNIIAFYYPNKRIYTPSDNEISHLIRIVGNSTEGSLYAYIELFNVLCFMVSLADNYEGENIDETYIYDLVANQEICKKFEFYHSKHQVQDSTRSRNITEHIASQFQQRLEKIMPRIVERQQGNMIKTAVDKALGKIPDGEAIQERHLNELLKELEPLMEYVAMQRCNFEEDRADV